MGAVIRVSFGLTWDYPVCVQSGPEDKMIDGPREALRYLLDEFSIQSGVSYRNAVVACRAALCNGAHLGRTRDVFIAAYAEYRFKASRQA